ncbi:MAG: hypothetical protein D6706_20960, partial [Chloroflexi bacterium]
MTKIEKTTSQKRGFDALGCVGWLVFWMLVLAAGSTAISQQTSSAQTAVIQPETPAPTPTNTAVALAAVTSTHTPTTTWTPLPPT